MVADEAELARIAEVLDTPSTDPETIRLLLGQRIAARLLDLSKSIDAELEAIRDAAVALSTTPPTTTSTTTTFPTIASTTITSTTSASAPPGAVIAQAEGPADSTDPGGAGVTSTSEAASSETRVPATSTTELVVSLDPQDLPEEEVLGVFEDAGLIELDDLASVVEPSERLTIVVIGQPSSGHDIGTVVAGMFAELLGADPGLPVVVAEATEFAESDESVAPSLVGAVRGDPDWRRTITTVDTLDDARGGIALVLAIEAMAQGRVGHYGDNDGSSRLLPLPP